MSDQFTSVEEKGLGTNLVDSIKGVAVGGLLFICSFIVLWMNEGRVDLSEVAKKSVVANPASVDSGLNGKFISVTGDLKTDEKIGDPELLNPGNYLRLHRNVEMYAWIETVKTSTEKKTGGKKVETRTVTYSKGWTDKPKLPNEMEQPKGHENIPLTIKDESFSAQKAQVAAYPFEVAEASLPSAEPLKLSQDMVKGSSEEAKTDAAPADAAKPADGEKAEGDAVKPAEDKAEDKADEDDQPKKKDKKKKRKGRSVKKPKPLPAEVGKAERKADAIAARKSVSFSFVDDKYLFKGSGTLAQPEIGDVRISFSALRPGAKVTLFGVLDGGQVRAYKDKESTLFRALAGSREEAIQTMHSEYQTVGWLLRLVGFLMMWFGLILFFGPINTLLDVIPFLGSAGRFLIAVAMFPIALLLSFVTILLSIIAHSPILLTLVFVGMAAGGYFLYQKKKKKAAA